MSAPSTSYGSNAYVAAAFGAYANAGVIGDVEANALIALGTELSDRGIGAVTFEGHVAVTASANGYGVGDADVTGNYAHIASVDGFAYVDASVNGEVGAHAAVRMGSFDGDTGNVGAVTFQKGLDCHGQCQRPLRRHRGCLRQQRPRGGDPSGR